MEPQRAPMRPRSKSGFSVASDKSDSTRRSANNKLRESHDEKRKHHLSETTKANPNAAMNELQPIAQQLEKATIGSLREGAYTDIYGNPITDPDLSNPTRRRTERPLETIRSFEAAIDGEYKRQRDRPESMVRTESAPDGYDYSSRRSSSHWGGGYDQQNGNGSRFSNVGGYYNQRGSHDNGGHPRRYQYNNARQHSDPALNRQNNAQGVYPSPNYGQSRDTVNTGGSNGSASDQWQNSTDPSSENSSVERMKADGYDPQYAHQYGGPGSREPISEEGNYTYGNGQAYNPGYMNGQNATSGYFGQGNNGVPAPPVPPKAMNQSVPRQLIKLDQPPATGHPSLQDQTKRKSWLRRTFSKGG